VRSLPVFNLRRKKSMKKYLLAAGVICAMTAPVFADEVGVRAGPVGVGATVGESHDRTVVREREPESKTVIKKEDSDGNREKTVIKKDRD
jgi:hypothetical protein